MGQVVNGAGRGESQVQDLPPEIGIPFREGAKGGGRGIVAEPGAAAGVRPGEGEGAEAGEKIVGDGAWRSPRFARCWVLLD